jgi:hypothetical protein
MCNGHTQELDRGLGWGRTLKPPWRPSESSYNPEGNDEGRALTIGSISTYPTVGKNNYNTKTTIYKPVWKLLVGPYCSDHQENIIQTHTHTNQGKRQGGSLDFPAWLLAARPGIGLHSIGRIEIARTS